MKKNQFITSFVASALLCAITPTSAADLRPALPTAPGNMSISPDQMRTNSDVAQMKQDLILLRNELAALKATPTQPATPGAGMQMGADQVRMSSDIAQMKQDQASVKADVATLKGKAGQDAGSKAANQALAAQDPFPRLIKLEEQLKEANQQIAVLKTTMADASVKLKDFQDRAPRYDTEISNLKSRADLTDKDLLVKSVKILDINNGLTSISKETLRLSDESNQLGNRISGIATQLQGSYWTAIIHLIKDSK